MIWKPINLQNHHWVRDESSPRAVVAREVRDEETALLISAAPDLLRAATTLIYALENRYGVPVEELAGDAFEVPFEAILLLHQAASKAAGGEA